MSFVSGKGFTSSSLSSASNNNKESSNNNKLSPFNPDDEDLGPSVSMAVMADSDHDFKKSTFGIKRTTSVGKFGIKTNQLSSLSSNNLASQNSESKYGSQPLTPPSNTKNVTSPPNFTSVNNILTNSNNNNNNNNNQYEYTSPPVNYSPQDISLSSTPEQTQQQPNTSSYSNTSNGKSNYSHEQVHFQPRDDVDLFQEPATHVDYFSHNWDESDISKSWKYIILQKKKKHTENKNDSLGLTHHDDSYSRSGSMISPSGTPNDPNFPSSRNGNNNLSSNEQKNNINNLENESTSESKKLTNQQQDLEIDMDVVNAARLENASWRTWAKARNNLKTVSPEIVNWSKESDVTWLYGPIVPGKQMSDSTPQNNNDTPEYVLGNEYGNDKDKNDNNNNKNETTLKPILKKRTVTEVIERNARWKLDQIRKNYLKTHGGKLPSHRFVDTSDLRSQSPAPFGGTGNKDSNTMYPHEDYSALAAKVNAQYNKKSDTNIKKSPEKSDDSLNNRRQVMARLLSTDKSSSPSSPLGSSENRTDDLNKLHDKHSSNSAYSKHTPHSSNTPAHTNSQPLAKKHIRFNDRVEQCVAIMPDNFGFNNNGVDSNKTGRGSSDEEDTKRIRKRSKIVLPSGITLGTGNGGSSDESSSDYDEEEEDDDDDDDNINKNEHKPDFDMDNHHFSDDMDIDDLDDDKPQFIENSTSKNDKPNYALGNTRYYRGPALPDSDSSEEDEDDDIMAIGKSAHNNKGNNSNSSSSGGLFIDSMRTKHFPQGLSSTPPARTISRPVINKLYSEPVNIISKPKYPAAIKRIPATCLNYKNEDLPSPSTNSKNDNKNYSDSTSQRGGNASDSYGYNNYDYNTVFTNSYILNSNTGVNVVDVPSQFAPVSTIPNRKNSINSYDILQNKSTIPPASDIIKQSNTGNDFDISSGLATKGSLSRTSSATSGLARGFAANLNLNPSSSDLRRPNFIDGKTKEKTKPTFQFNQNDDDDDGENSDEESDDEGLSLSSSRSSSMPAFNQNKSFNSFIGGTKNPSSSTFLNKPPSLSQHSGNIGGKSFSFISGIKDNTMSSDETSNVNNSDFGAPLKKVLSRSDSLKNVSNLSMNDIAGKNTNTGRFNHTLRPPPKKSFSFFDEGNDSDSE
ncbi:hypothetical protein ACO0SA_000526 [Hanseniaspora valbyensis]